jgi:tyrosyl-tRNA synthetase
MNKTIEKLKKGIEIMLPENSLEKKIKEKNDQPLNIKLGFDPTAPDLHLGHFVVLKKLRDFQDAGHKIFVIVGDFTAQIGDPTGKNKTRPPLSRQQIEINAKTYIEQLSKVLDVNRIQIKKNSEWMDKMNLHDTLKLLASYNLGRMMTRDDFNKRFKAELPIGMHEIAYPLLQGYDSLMIDADIEIGGSP